MTNEILIKHPKNWGLDEALVLKTATEALEEKKLDSVELSIIFVGRKKAKELNIKYREKDYVPQVLGFPMSREPDEDGMIRLGDVVICTQKLKYEVEFQKKSLKEVLKEWMAHGVENLLK
jgi:probable rRNA maturation factor